MGAPTESQHLGKNKPFYVRNPQYVGILWGQTEWSSRWVMRHPPVEAQDYETHESDRAPLGRDLDGLILFSVRCTDAFIRGDETSQTRAASRASTSVGVGEAAPLANKVFHLGLSLGPGVAPEAGT